MSGFKEAGKKQLYTPNMFMLIQFPQIYWSCPWRGKQFVSVEVKLCHPKHGIKLQVSVMVGKIFQSMHLYRAK